MATKSAAGDGKMFSSAHIIERIVWQMRMADYNRAADRAKIASLANGAPPYTQEEETRNKIEVNVSDLTLTRLSREAQLQLYQGFFKPGNFFTCRTDSGAADRRGERGAVVTKNVNRFLKRSNDYYQTFLSKIGNLVLHGNGPGNWENQDRWCPIPLSVGDILMPSKTLLSFRNLPFFAVFRSYSPHELIKLTRNCEVYNPGWNMPMINRIVQWSENQTAKLFSGTTWSDYWKPDELQSRIKEDGGVYASDLVQMIDSWDFYYWDDAGDKEGWRRRIVLDAEGGAKAWMTRDSKTVPGKNLLGDDKGQFLYDSGDRVVAKKIQEILGFQFGDLSAVFPARYHAVRGLGFMLYAVCHLQNRLWCKVSAAVFENLMMYMRVASMDDFERALKVELVDKGFVDESVRFLSPQERYQPDHQLAMLGLNGFKQIISDNSAAYTQNHNMSRDRVEKTAFQVQAEVNAMMTLVSSALQQAYRYQQDEYEEIFRRFLRSNSEDPDVNEFQARCVAGGVPAEYLKPGCWEIEPERIMGSGNKTLEMAIARQLMEWREAFSAEAQDIIKRDAVLAISDDPAKAQELVPHKPGVSSDRYDAMAAFGSMMAGSVMEWRKDQNRLAIAQTLVAQLQLSVQEAMQQGGAPSLDKAVGMQNVANHLHGLLDSLGRDKQQKPNVDILADILMQLENEIRGFMQRAQEREQAAQQGGENGELELARMKELIKLEGMQAQSEIKQQNTQTAHSQRTAQRAAQDEFKQEQDEQKHSQELRHRAEDHSLEVARAATQIELEKERAAAKPPPGAGNGGGE